MAGIYTEADLNTVQEAIVKLASGKRAAFISVAGRSSSYQQAQLGELRALRDEIKRELGFGGMGRQIRMVPKGAKL